MQFFLYNKLYINQRAIRCFRRWSGACASIRQSAPPGRPKWANAIL